jgi:hypothetical protein
MKRNFFGIQDRDINTMTFIDRLNIFTKSGYTMDIQFTDEELVKEAISNPMQFGNDKVDPQFAAFRATQLLAQQLVGLQYLPVKEFSVMTK